MASKKCFDSFAENQSHAPRIVRNCQVNAIELHGICSKKMGLIYFYFGVLVYIVMKY